MFCILQVIDEYSEQIHDLSRRFFHALVRQGQLIKAFRLAVDINDYDLFVDLHHAAKRYNMTDMADAAIIKVCYNKNVWKELYGPILL